MKLIADRLFYYKKQKKVKAKGRESSFIDKISTVSSIIDIFLCEMNYEFKIKTEYVHILNIYIHRNIFYKSHVKSA